GNVNPETKRGLFEPVHGTAPDIAGRGLVNPIGAILSASMMVKHLGHTDMASAIEGAVESAIRAGECTRDLGGGLSTGEVGDAVARRLKDLDADGHDDDREDPGPRGWARERSPR